MASRPLRALVSLVLAAAVSLAAAPGTSAAGWWARVGAAPADLTQVASNTGSPTLAIAGGVAGWLWPGTGEFDPSGVGEVSLVAAAGPTGLALRRDGRLYRYRRGSAPVLVQTLPGRPIALVVAAGRSPRALAATADGLFLGPLTGVLVAVAAGAGEPLALGAPAGPALPFVVATVRGVELLRQGGTLVASPGSPRLGSGAVVTGLADGAVLAASPSGLVWGLYRDGWQPAFQLLPGGGLSGVPRVTALAAVGGSAAYLATAGFGALLTPDGGYSWYRTAPAGARPVLGLATSGRVTGARASGLVVAVTAAGLYVHRLQPLPAPPVYSGSRGSLELLGTALVTALATALAIALLWLWDRHRRRGLFV